jgi:CheY-like chemotaxis protein
MAIFETLLDAGAHVVGPFPNTATALVGISEANIDAAVLDVHLGLETAYPVAEQLWVQRIPFIFVTTLAQAEIRADFAHNPYLQKPCLNAELISAVQVLVA